MLTRRIMLIAQPLLRQSPRQLNPNHPLTHTQHLRIIANNALLNTVAIMCRHRPDSLDLVRSNSHPQSSSTDQDRPIGFTLCDESGGGGGSRGVVGQIGDFLGADVDDFRDSWVGFEVGLDCFTVANAGELLWC